MSDQIQGKISSLMPPSEKFDNYEEEFEEEILSGQEASRKTSHQEQDKKSEEMVQDNQQNFEINPKSESDRNKNVRIVQEEPKQSDYMDQAYINQQQQSQQINPVHEGLYNTEPPPQLREDSRPKTHHTHQRPHFEDINQPPVPVQDNLMNLDNSPFQNQHQSQGNRPRFQSNNGRPPTHGVSGHSHANFQNATFEDFKAIPVQSMNQTSQVRQQQIINPAHRKSSQQPQRSYNSYEKDPNRRQFIAQILNQNQNQNASIDNSQPSKQYHVLNFNNAISKRKKIKELIYGQSLKTSLLQQKEKEELLQEKRFLKQQQNITNEENIKLKTKIQQLQNELGKRDKDIEQLVIQYQLLQQSQKGQQVQIDSHVYESFLVSQLKRTNRELRQEVQEKDKVIDQLKRDQKLTKTLELETELDVYIQECTRLRGLLEQAFFERQAIVDNQTQDVQMTQQQQQNIQKLEEAYFEKENQLQQEREARNQLSINYIQIKEQLDKANEKTKLAEGRMKKINELQSQTKRQEVMLRQKNKELIDLKQQIETLRIKASERDSVYNKNKELVTKQYAMQSSIEAKEKQIQQLKQENDKLQEQTKHNLRSNTSGINPSPNRSTSTPNKLPPNLPPPKQIGKYNENLILFIQRSLKDQPLIHPNDKQTYKNYVASNRSEIDKEVESIKGLKLKKETREHLQGKQDQIVSNLSKNFNFQQLEKFFEENLQMSDKDQRKYVMIYSVIIHSPSSEQFNLSNLLTEIKNPSFIEEAEEPNTVRVNESVGETTGQFLPPSNFNNTPIVGDEQFKSKNSSLVEKKEASPAKQPPPREIEEVDEYEEDNFEQMDQSEQVQQQKHSQKLEQEDMKQDEDQGPKLEKKETEEYEEDNFENPDEGAQVNAQEINYEEQNILDQQQQQQLAEQQQLQEQQEELEGEAEQITEEQMLDIAESVFELIGERLKQLNMSVFKAFGQQAQIIEQFEDKENVEVVGAREFLDSLEKLQIKELTQIQAACLMQVLSRPELNHAIILQELQMVLNNFGVPEEAQEEQQKTKEQLVNKKQKQNKKKIIQILIKNDNSPVFSELFNVLRVCGFNIDVLSEIIQEKCYEQLVKQKTKEVAYILIKKDDFFGLIKEKTGVQISTETQEQLGPILQLDNKYQDIFQLKFISILFQEALERIRKDEEDQKKLQEFYSPEGENENQDGGGGEVINFEQMMENYEDDYEREELNAIQEDKMEESASPSRSIHPHSPDRE